jgi:hypothetical protein
LCGFTTPVRLINTAAAAAAADVAADVAATTTATVTTVVVVSTSNLGAEFCESYPIVVNVFVIIVSRNIR